MDQATDALVAQLQRVAPPLLQNQPVDLAYLYGSAALGRATPLSDVDIALVASELPPPHARLKLMLSLQLDIDEQCDISNADVRVINDAPLILRGKVVTEGILIYERDPSIRVAFETDTRMRYFDYLPVYRRWQEEFLAEIRERGLYG